jgi:myo-inositol catabolism protein IolC
VPPQSAKRKVARAHPLTIRVPTPQSSMILCCAMRLQLADLKAHWASKREAVPTVKLCRLGLKAAFALMESVKTLCPQQPIQWGLLG